MKAAYKRNGLIEVREVEERCLDAGQIRLTIEACGICGTDIHGTEETFMPFGHEVAGEVVEIGEGVRHLHVGQKVVLDSATPCGRCEMCRNMRQDLCMDKQSFYYIGDFGFAERMIAPAISAIPYDGLLPQVASLQEPLGVAIDLCRVTEVGPENSVLVMGQGPIGIYAAAVSRYLGANHVFVCDYASKTGRKRVSESMDIDGFIDVEHVQLGTYDFPVAIDRILVTSPPPTLPTAFAAAAEGAHIGFIGIGQGEGAKCTFDANDFHFKKLQLRSSFASPALFGPKALMLLKAGLVPTDLMISHTYPLERMQQAYSTAVSDPEAVKVVMVQEL